MEVPRSNSEFGGPGKNDRRRLLVGRRATPIGGTDNRRSLPDSWLETACGELSIESFAHRGTADVQPKQVRVQFKAWCTRRLKELEAKRLSRATPDEKVREKWWVERGSDRFINDNECLEAATLYVRDAQDDPARY
jgi:hypothetical protein